MARRRRRVVTVADLLAEFEAATFVETETENEKALQRVGFLSGVMAALGTLASGVTVSAEGCEDLIQDAMAGMHMEADRYPLRLVPSDN